MNKRKFFALGLGVLMAPLVKLGECLPLKRVGIQRGMARLVDGQWCAVQASGNAYYLRAYHDGKMYKMENVAVINGELAHFYYGKWWVDGKPKGPNWLMGRISKIGEFLRA